MLTIRDAREEDWERWDSYVLSHGSGGPYHLSAWHHSVRKAYGHACRSVLAEDHDGAIRGILPLILIRPPLIRGSLVSQPFCDYGGILADDQEATGCLIAHVGRLVRERGLHFEIRSRVPDEMLDRHAFRSTSNKARMVLELPGSAETLWNSLKSKLRSQIRRPLKEGMEFQMGTGELLDEFYGVFCRNMHNLGSPVHSRKWIQAVLDFFGGTSKVGIVKYGGKSVAGGVIIGCRDTVSLPWASTMREYNHLSPNMLLYWGFLEHACNNGFRYFDFGRSTPDEGTYSFKRQWGAEPHALYWYRERADTHQGYVQTGGMARAMLERVWSRLPLGVANTVGPLIRGYISL